MVTDIAFTMSRGVSTIDNKCVYGNRLLLPCLGVSQQSIIDLYMVTYIAFTMSTGVSTIDNKCVYGNRHCFYHV